MATVSQLLAGGTYGSAGASNAALFADWGNDYRDPNWISTLEGATLGARSEDLARNNPVAAAAIETMTAGVLGEDGLRFRSLMVRDLATDTSTQEDTARRAINECVRRATLGTRFDAMGQRTWRELAESYLTSSLLTGNAFAVRLLKPNRGGRQYQSTCVRLIHSSRVCNPNFGADTDTMHRGLQLDADGTPIGVHIRRYHQVTSAQPNDWTYVPLYAADGTRQVTHLRRAPHPDQLLGTAWMGPILSLLKQFGGVTDAYVVAKRIQACYPVIITTEDPTTLATAQRNGTLLSSNTKLQPGKIYVAKTGTEYSFENLQFNGADHMAFGESLLQLASAAIGLPYEVLINRLSKSNLASARAALLAAYRAYRIQQHALITQGLETWVEWMVQEDLARGRLPDAEGVDLDLVLRGKWLRPPVPTPNPKQDIDAATQAINIGVAPSDAFAMFGLPEYDSTIHQHAQDTRTREAQNVVYGTAGVVPMPEPLDPAATGDANPGDPAAGDAGTTADPGTT